MSCQPCQPACAPQVRIIPPYNMSLMQDKCYSTSSPADLTVPNTPVSYYSAGIDEYRKARGANGCPITLVQYNAEQAEAFAWFEEHFALPTGYTVTQITDYGASIADGPIKDAVLRLGFPLWRVDVPGALPEDDPILYGFYRPEVTFKHLEVQCQDDCQKFCRGLLALHTLYTLTPALVGGVIGGGDEGGVEIGVAGLSVQEQSAAAAAAVPKGKGKGKGKTAATSSSAQVGAKSVKARSAKSAAVGSRSVTAKAIRAKGVSARAYHGAGYRPYASGCCPTPAPGCCPPTCVLPSGSPVPYIEVSEDGTYADVVGYPLAVAQYGYLQLYGTASGCELKPYAEVKVRSLSQDILSLNSTVDNVDYTGINENVLVTGQLMQAASSFFSLGTWNGLLTIAKGQVLKNDGNTAASPELTIYEGQITQGLTLFFPEETQTC